MTDKEDYLIKPQFAFLGEILGDFLDLCNHIANFRAVNNKTTSTQLKTSTCALYLKRRIKIKEESKKGNKDKYKFLTETMDKYIFNQENILDKDLLKAAKELCEYIEMSGMTNVETETTVDPFKDFENTFPS